MSADRVWVATAGEAAGVRSEARFESAKDEGRLRRARLDGPASAETVALAQPSKPRAWRVTGRLGGGTTVEALGELGARIKGSAALGVPLHWVTVEEVTRGE